MEPLNEIKPEEEHEPNGLHLSSATVSKPLKVIFTTGQHSPFLTNTHTLLAKAAAECQAAH